MKVLQLIDSLATGGAERMCVNIANLLADSGIPVVVCATRTGGAMEKKLKPSVPYYQLNKKGTLDVVAFFRLLRLLKKEQITHIHAHSSSVFWAVAAGFFFRGLKIIWHDHYGQSEGLQAGSRKPLAAISGFIDFAIPVNSRLRDWILANTAIPEDKIISLPNFPDGQWYAATPADSTSIVCLANFRAQKNHRNLLEAIACIKPNLNGFKVVLAGQAGDARYLDAIHQAIRTLGLSSTVSVVHAMDSPERLLAEARIGVLSSDSEGLPLALLEYGMAGLAVVCTQVGQCAEVLDEGRCGILVPPNDPQALATALQQLLTDDSLASILGQRLQRRVRATYSGTAFLEGYLPLLHGIHPC